ncbi:YdcF family protein [Lysobacter sp. D1-1-M9]|uniref:YdcF family protein n=1 Tax=Novilysobacter longmucuonensis TaxID=3098603 RepID=UPI002FCBD5CB
MKWLLSPLVWLLLAAVLAPIAWQLRSRAKWLAAGCLALAVAAWLAMTPLVANSLLDYLERPVAGPATCLTDPPSTVVVLAGGVDRPPQGRADFAVLNLASRRRIERGVQYWREREGRQVVVTGGAVAAGPATLAELMGRYAQWQGVPGPALHAESHSANTRENAENVARMMPGVPRRIALVTSALHMPRARLSFEAVGFEVCPLPTDFRTVPVGAPGYLLPRTSSLLKTEAALHELVGIRYYGWRGWLDRQPHDSTE